MCDKLGQSNQTRPMITYLNVLIRFFMLFGITVKVFYAHRCKLIIDRSSTVVDKSLVRVANLWSFLCNSVLTRMIFLLFIHKGLLRVNLINTMVLGNFLQH